MKTTAELQLTRSIRRWITLFMVLLILSGITAFPLETELNWLHEHNSLLPETMRSMLLKIRDAVRSTNIAFPELAYGTDWLAFAHIVIAAAFIGPLMDPVRNIWVIQFGMIACVMVFPLALIAGPLRQIPFYWRLVDCSFGLFGLFPLYFSYKAIRKLESIKI